MLSRDPFQTVSAFTSSTVTPKIRAGIVASIQDDRTITVTLAGDSTEISGIYYLENVVPQVGKVVWLVVQDGDIFAIGHIAENDATLAPRASYSTTQTIADASDVAVTFDGVNSDAFSCWNLAQPTRLTAPLTGRYMAVGTITFAGNSTGIRAAWIEKTGSSTLARVQVAPAAGLPTWINVSTPPFDMIAGSDYIRLFVRQTSGGLLALNNSSTFSPALSLIYLGP